MQSGNIASLEVDLNGLAWKCTQVGATVQNYNGNSTLLIHAQKPPTEGSIEYVYLTVSSFSGVGNYTFGNKDDKGSIKIAFQNKNYSSDGKLGGGNGSVKIIEYIKSPSPGKPGKVVGEINGKLKFGNNTLTITNGKFSSTMVLWIHKILNR